MLESALKTRMAMDQIRYSTVWEDASLLSQGLEIHPSDDVLSIGSAGCNVLSLLAEEPRRIVAIDLSPAQLALIELKLKAISEFSRPQFLQLLTEASPENEGLYESLRPKLSERAREFWDSHREILKSGVDQCGRLERYFKKFRDEGLGHVWNPEELQGLLASRTLSEQRKWLEPFRFERLEKVIDAFFNREELGRHGRDPAQFQYVTTENVARFFFKRFGAGLRSQLIRENFYIYRFFTGKYFEGDEPGPSYLSSACFDRLKRLVDRVQIVEQDLESYLSSVSDGSFSKANLSDLFEYVDDDHAQKLFGLLAEKLRPEGRIAYWNLLVPRRPRTERLVRLSPLSESLFEKDRVWFYQDFNVYGVLG